MISWRKHYKSALVALGMLLSAGAPLHAQEGDPKKGEQLFKTNCTACHALDKQLVGPALEKVEERLQSEAGVDRDWLHKWIKDNKALRESGDKYANEVYEKYNKSEMQLFPNLSEQDIDDILAYTANPPAKEEAAAGGEKENANSLKAIEDAQKNSVNSRIVMVSLFVIAGLLLWLLIRLRELVKLQRDETLDVLQEGRVRNFGEIYEKYNPVFKGLLGLLALLALYGIWNSLMWIGVYKGYKPEQPIYFSHKIHAGENKIDCQLCHSGAKYGKVSEIPSLNVCMNCHRNISEYNGKYMEPGKDKAFYDAEIQKIYEHAGWDPATQSYTGKAKPVQWVRIHNMQDFVYFNHAQHVVAGEKAIIDGFNKKNPNNQIDIVCKACHGKIDTMNVVQMANDFTMGWCIECHRTTEVDMNNGYNQAYFSKLHEKLKKQYPKDGGKITVDAIGGLECGKCHY
ncbi:Cytochrome c, mono-and diheme variants [Cruoricaptor ignavus]|uniref:Cytochrome c, mono-and diheme variants n=1 Tax=Cruoricaptor ignavus TaxID=1118202 RepID=A0A1M6FJM0_9FLAO|nr:c-type cytochrome [Cruoricaptor ignavus]SHI97921.1 Cytochrome c, mono-and diheme variants [Cruoricaptor ignavus]